MSIVVAWRARLRSLAFPILLPAVLLGACATPLPVHQALPDAVRNQVSSVDVVLPVKQSEIYVFVPASNVSAAAGGGLLAALVDAGIDSIRNSKAEAAVKPLRDSIVDYSFDNSLRTDTAAALTKLTWTKAGDPVVIKEVTSQALDAAIAQSKADAVLFANADYHLSNDGYVLDVVVGASLFAKSDALKAVGPSKLKTPISNPANTLYRNVITYESMAPMGTVDQRDKNIAIWSADHGAPMRSALTKGAAKLAQLLADDLQGELSPSDQDGAASRGNDGTIKYLASTDH